MRYRSVSSHHVTYAFQSEFTLYSCLNIKELLARSRRETWSLMDCNWTGTHNHLVYKEHSTIQPRLSVCLWTKWLRVRVQLQSLEISVLRCTILIKNLWWNLIGCRSSRLQLFFKSDNLKNFATFTWSLFKKRLYHRCFPVIFVKFLRTPFLKNNSVGYFCGYWPWWR